MSNPIRLAHDWLPDALPANVVIGERSWLYSSYAFLHYRSQRPRGVKIGQNTGIYIDTLFEVGIDGEVTIGSYCTIAGAIIVTNERIVIGDYVLISREVVLADDAIAVPPTVSQSNYHSNYHLKPSSDSSFSITLGNDVWIGTRAILLKGAQLGNGVIVGAGAVVDFAVPDGAVVAGNPAKIVGWTSL